MSSRAMAGPKPRLTGRAALLSVLVLLLGLSGIVPVRQYLSQRDQMASLQRKVDALVVEKAKLRAKIRALEDPEELERLARECLGMVKPGEIAFAAVPNGGGTLPRPC